MTISPTSLTDLSLPALAGRRIEVRWTAIVAASSDLLKACTTAPGMPCRLSFVIAVQVVNDHRALIEAWLGTPLGLRSILNRQPVTCATSFDGHLLHIDAHLDGRRVLALSLAPLDRAVYAQSPLLSEAGLAPGAYDRPTARLLAAQRDVASA